MKMIPGTMSVTLSVTLSVTQNVTLSDTLSDNGVFFFVSVDLPDHAKQEARSSG